MGAERRGHDDAAAKESDASETGAAELASDELDAAIDEATGATGEDLSVDAATDPDDDSPDDDSPEDDAADSDDEGDSDDEDSEEPRLVIVDPSEILFDEPGGSKAAIWIGPVLIAAVVALEIIGGGRIHWEVLTIFGVVLVGFGALQYAAARRHVSVLLTEEYLRQGAETVALADIAEIYPENRGQEYQKWESARALGELHAVPRRRKGVGVRFKNGKIAQAWARDVDRFRSELSDAVLAVKLGLNRRADTEPKSER